MLGSPKMQRNIRVNDSQLMMLSERAHFDHSLSGFLHKRAADSNKWQQRWFVLYQNILFYYESESNSRSRPSGVVLLEGCYCERLITPGGPSYQSCRTAKDGVDKQQYCFAISYRRENLRIYELKASTEMDCKMWIEAIREASFNKVLMQKEELEQKHLHLLQIVESEKTAKWQYTQQCEELTSEIKKLRAELCALKKEWRPESGSAGLGYSSGCYGGTQAAGADPEAAKDLPNMEEDMSSESQELRKIKKVQSFFRGWLCRRRWKQIVEQYIKSPHAESMRKRNSLVFRMVEAEEEYMEQMEVLVSCFLRPFKMAASSKKPPCSHEDVNSIFLNSETVLFLHQIFLKGLTSRMESWPTLVLGDLFDMLLPMLSIYQEYVRNHHYSVQVLTECMKNPQFAALVHRLEEKPACQGRSLATFLTYPMHQVPRYVTTLTDLLAHTPHDHVERKSLMNAQHQLEDLSRQMHDEVSETENLRKNLAVERMIVEGCDILLDVNQVFVRQGTLTQIPSDKPRTPRSRLTSFKTEKEAVRQCFLFSNHLIIATRASSGRLHLVPEVGKLSLADAILIEDPSDSNTADDDESVCSMSSQSSSVSEASSRGGISASQVQNRDFKIVLDNVKCNSQQISVHLLAPTAQEKTAWISDIQQCMDNVHFNDLLHNSMSDTSSVTMPQSIKNDPKLFKDDVDIRFSRTLNSCKVPQIRYATPERLLERLTDLRFLSIDFLNTFLLTYRVFTDSVTVLEALKKVFYNADPPDMGSDGVSILLEGDMLSSFYDPDRRRSSFSPRRTSGASSVSGYGSEMSSSDRDRSHSYDSQSFRGYWRQNVRKYEDDQINRFRERVGNPAGSGLGASQSSRRVSIRVEQDDEDYMSHLTVPNQSVNISSSTETVTEMSVASTSPSNLSTVTLKPTSSTSTSPTPSLQDSQGSSGVSTVTVIDARELKSSHKRDSEKEKDEDNKKEKKSNDAAREKNKDDNKNRSKSKEKVKDDEKDSTRLGERRPSGNERTERRPSIVTVNSSVRTERRSSGGATSQAPSERRPSNQSTNSYVNRRPSSADRRTSSADRRPSSATGDRRLSASERRSPRSQAKRKGSDCGGPSSPYKRDSIVSDPWTLEDCQDTPRSSHRSASIASSAMSYYDGRRLTQDSICTSQGRLSFQHETPQASSRAGVVITSGLRQSHRRSSTSTAATAFAIAVSASSNPREPRDPRDFSPALSRMSCSSASGCSTKPQNRRKESVLSTAATMRVLNVLRHWVSKHAQDFDQDQRLKNMTIEFLDDIMSSPSLLPAEYKAASQLHRLMTKDEPANAKIDLATLLAPPTSPSKENIETLSALEIAEQMTYLDHQIFVAICSEEFLGQAWIRTDKNIKAPRIEAMTRRFNEMSALVVSEIVRRNAITARVSAIEKWAAVADISRCLHNFNGVLQICAAFNNNVIFRLKKTWEKVSKTTKQTIHKLQAIVSSDGRFRNLRESLHRCDPPCIPYLGMYLTDLSFIEESTPNFSNDNLLNFSKMRMIAHVIREVRHFQQVPYKIDHIPKVTTYLQDPALRLDEDEMYRLSLDIEPRQSRLSAANTAAIGNITTTAHHALFSGTGSHER